MVKKREAVDFLYSGRRLDALVGGQNLPIAYTVSGAIMYLRKFIWKSTRKKKLTLLFLMSIIETRHTC